MKSFVFNTFTSVDSKELTLTTRPRLLNRYGLRLLPGMTRQTCRIAVDAQFLCPARLQLVLREHPENCFAHDPLRPGLAQALHRHGLQSTRVPAVRVIYLLFDL